MKLLIKLSEPEIRDAVAYYLSRFPPMVKSAEITAPMVRVVIEPRPLDLENPFEACAYAEVPE